MAHWAKRNKVPAFYQFTNQKVDVYLDFEKITKRPMSLKMALRFSEKNHTKRVKDLVLTLNGKRWECDDDAARSLRSQLNIGDTYDFIGCETGEVMRSLIARY